MTAPHLTRKSGRHYHKAAPSHMTETEKTSDRGFGADEQV